MTKVKGVKWAQFLKLLTEIANTLVTQFATKTDLDDVKKNRMPTIVGSTLTFPADAEAKIEGSTLVLSK